MDRRKVVKAYEDTSQKNSGNELRSPICCILDTGETKLLDCIERTIVQEGEAGYVTQQIGATYFPTKNIKELKADATLKIPGLLFIDTPGCYQSFTRGSSVCDIAVLVLDILVDIVGSHFQPQTLQYLDLLKSRNTNFIVALMFKADRLDGWKLCPNATIVKTIKQQSKLWSDLFYECLTVIITKFKDQGLNTTLYVKNKRMGETFNIDTLRKEQTFSIVPINAISGDGIPDLLLVLIQWAQKTMEDKLTYVDEVKCTVLEVKVMEGLGTTIDVVLVNGVLHEGDQIVVCGMQGPIVTTIKALLTPYPMKELRVEGTYLHHKEIKTAQGIKISAQGLEHAIAGTALYVVGPDDDLKDYKETVMKDMKKIMGQIDESGEGVYVQASTLGSMEALTEFLKSPSVGIPFCDFNIGSVHKEDVVKASLMMSKAGKREYGAILAFDVKIMPDARDLANESNVIIFESDIICHLVADSKASIRNFRKIERKAIAEDTIFPCILTVLRCVSIQKNKVVLVVDVTEGYLKIGTPICIPSRGFIDIGKIDIIMLENEQVKSAKKHQMVTITISCKNSEDEHFWLDAELVSHITRRSIDVLKAYYRDVMTSELWILVVKLKQIFRIL